MLYPSDAWSLGHGSAINSDQAEALKILDEMGGLSSMEAISSMEEGRKQQERKPGRGGARTLPASAMRRATSSPTADKWKKAGRRIAPGIVEETEKPAELKALSRFAAGLPGKKTISHSLRRTVTAKKLGLGPSKPSRWADVLGAVNRTDDNSQWNDLLAGVGFGDTMQRLSSYYQNNAILAGLLATIIFSTMSGGRLFDLERGTLTCPVSGPDPCMLTRSPYEPQQLKVSHHIF
jgi:hypothetical protein